MRVWHGHQRSEMLGDGSGEEVQQVGTPAGHGFRGAMAHCSSMPGASGKT